MTNSVTAGIRVMPGFATRCLPITAGKLSFGLSSGENGDRPAPGWDGPAVKPSA
jgi:hypothetical protein